MLPKTLTVFWVIAVCVSTQGCTSESKDALPVPRGTVPMVIDPGADAYTNVSENLSEISPQPTQTSSSASKPDASQSKLAKELCTRVGDNAIKFSKISAESSGEPYLTRLLGFDLVADNRNTVTIPSSDRVAVVIECRVEVELSTGDTGSVTLYELLDSDGNTRIRWDDYLPD